MDDYNRALDSAATPARRSGWRRAVEQHVRFEVVASRWDWSGAPSVLDLGCGTGQLCEWLVETGRSCRYTGVDVRASVIEEARRRHPEGRFLRGDFYDDLEGLCSHDLVVAVGSLIDGRAPDDERDRRRRVERLVGRAFELSRGGAVVDVLDRESIAEQPSLRLEPSVFGARRRELSAAMPEGLAEHIVEGPILGRDWVAAGTWTAGIELETGRIEVVDVVDRIIELTEPSSVDVAWMWLEAGCPERAAGVLEGIDGGGTVGTAELRHLEERLAVERRAADSEP